LVIPKISILARQTYGCETISTLLYQTRQLWHPDYASKRYEDTTVLFGEITLNAPDSPRHIAAVARMNVLHAPYIASGKLYQADLVYTLAMCIHDPLKFYRLYEWREPNDMEKAAMATMWKSIADDMEMDYKGLLAKDTWADGLEFYDDIGMWARKYEADHLKFSALNEKLGNALLGLMTSSVPRWMKGFVEGMLLALMGDRGREAFG
jgi:hypothetical protein